MQKICVLGLGYIGLPTASMFATHGFQVVGVDVNDREISKLNAGGIHIEEPGLETMVQAAPGPSHLIAAARRLNDRNAAARLCELTQTALASIEKPVIAALGLAYKANVDDARESPSVSVIRWLQSAGYEIRSYDPYVKNSPVTGAVSSLRSSNSRFG